MGKILASIVLALFTIMGLCSVIYASSEDQTDLENIYEMSIEDLMNVSIVSASLREETLSKAAAPIYIVTAREIKDRGYSTLKDVMEDVMGYIDLSDTNENIVGVRGAYASTTNKILIMINGHRMNSLSLGRYNTDQYIGMDAVERIEFVMGPGSVLYGTGAVIGVVNIITKKGADAEGVSLHSRFGSFHDEHSITYGEVSDEINIFANFTYLDGEGDEISQPAYLDVVPTGQTQAPGDIYWNRYPENWSGLFSLQYKAFDVTVRRGHASRGTPRAANGSFYIFEQEEDTGWPAVYQQDDFFIDVKTERQIDEDTKLVINPSYHRIHLLEQSWISQYGANRLPPLGSRSGQNSIEEHWQLKTYVDHKFSEKLDAMLGIDFLYADFTQSEGLVIQNGTTVQIIPERYDLGTWTIFGAFAQASWRPVKKLDITAGVRYDDFGEQGNSKLTSRFGAVYTVDDNWTVKALYGESYLSPQWEHTKLNPNYFAFVSNPSLEPEELQSGDFIVQYQKNNISGWVDVFIQDIDGIITPVTQAGKQIYTNLGRSQYWGTETGFKVDVTKKWRAFGSYSLVEDTGKSDDQFTRDGNILNVPRHIYRYGLRYQPWKDMTLLLWGRSYSQVQTSDSVTGNTTIAPWTHLDFAATYKKKNYELQFKVINLLDEEYEVGGTVTRPLSRYERGCVLSILYRF
jgi:outer membrane receptor for ferrienterochelin and colicins